MAAQPPPSFGLMGEYFSMRHALGHYRSAAVTATYSTSLSNDSGPVTWLRNAYESSLQATINEHPGLCYGLEGHHASDLALKFKQLKKIQQNDVIKYIETNCADNDCAFDDFLCRELEKAHEELWVAEKPAWRTIVFHEKYGGRNESPQTPAPSRIKFHVAFLAHHTIADGMSGRAFHTCLFDHLKEASDNSLQTKWPMTLPNTIQTPPSIDYLFSGLDPTISQGPDKKTPVWAGGAISLPSVEGYKSRLHLVTVPLDQLYRVLEACKAARITLTGLLHGLICTTLRRSLTNPPGFRAVTPYSIRRFTNASPRDIVNHAFAMAHDVSGAQLKEIQETEPQSSNEAKIIAKLARDFGRTLEAKIGEFPDGALWTGFANIKDLEQHCRSQVGEPRGYTYEVSNLGSLRIPASPTANASLSLERLIFTQCGMVTGPAIAFNCASMQGGPLTISITWQHGIVEEELVDQLAEDLKQRLVLDVDNLDLLA